MMKITKKNRFIPVIAAVAIQLCLGTAYIWSVFQTGIAKSLFGGNNATAGITFSALLAMLGFGSTFGGKLAKKYSPRITVLAGGFILAAGFFGASLATPQAPWVLWLTYGLLGGFGAGMTYSTTIACAQKWYPDKKGLVTGIIVASLGLGGVVFTPLAETLIGLFGGVAVGELMTLRVLSGIFLVICTTGGLFIQDPPADLQLGSSQPKDNKPKNIAGKDFTLTEMLKTPQFYLLFFTFFFGCMAGLMMIGFAKPIAVAKGMKEVASIGVLIISIFNAAGRLSCGALADKFGPKRTLLGVLLGTAILAPMINIANGYFIFLLIALISFCYGGLLSNFPVLTAELFGNKNVATNYGLVLLGFGLGAIIASYIAGYFKNLAAQDITLILPAFLIASAAAVISMILLSMVKKPQTK
ncbi:MAG: OFA family MFS transporter [Clostridia bacterium]